MKKLVSFVVFTALLIWSWTVVHSVSNTGFETHAGIQDKLTVLIENLIQSKKPNVTNVIVQKMITESLGQDKVKAHFTYSFQEQQEGGEISEQVIQGEAVLQREPSENLTEDKWVLQSVKTTNDSISFVEGTVIGPDSGVEPITNTPEGEAAPQAPAPSTETSTPSTDQ